MKALLGISAVFIACCILSGTAFSQEGERDVLFKNKESGYVCEFVDTESDSPPPYFLIANDYGAYALFPDSYGEEWQALRQLGPDTPVTFLLEVVYAFDELSEENVTMPYISKMTKTGEPVPGKCGNVMK
jgi:hypothetical protein